MGWFRAARDYTELLERVEKLERREKELELAWELAYEKIRSMLGRLAKRAEAVTPLVDAAPAETVSPVSPNHLSPRQLSIQQMIETRRRKGATQ